MNCARVGEGHFGCNDNNAVQKVLVIEMVKMEILVVVVLAMIKETMKLVLMNIKMIMLMEMISKSLVLKVENKDKVNMTKKS